MQMVHYNKWKIGQNQVCFLLNRSLPCKVVILKYWIQVLLLCIAIQNPLFGWALCCLSYDIFRHKQRKLFIIILEGFWKGSPRSLLKYLFWVSRSQWGRSWYAPLLACCVINFITIGTDGYCCRSLRPSVCLSICLSRTTLPLLTL